MKPFNRERFLLVLLSSIFAYQASIFAYGVWTCTQVMPKTSISQVCPDLRRTYTETFSVQIATVLALLGGGAVAAGVSRRADNKPDEKDPPENPKRSAINNRTLG